MDEDWIDGFREWAIEVPIVSSLGKVRKRAPGTVEVNVRNLAAAVNFAHGRKDTLFPAAFTAKPPEEVSRTSSYQADIPKIAAMFHYCVDPEREPEDTEKVIVRRKRERAAAPLPPDQYRDLGAARRGSRRLDRSGEGPVAF